ncbi:TRAP transporter small permease [Paraliomyxa miuraensis]|uniref:TRAP transporter small permease n=1 Tax=Paraliomyxa miuraensis TaxID=376150 RepID=UPI0022585D9B|nr:TRAP transporter small permease [Paraliomyxa miuraensis]MCX4247315.1 TRAP transporter small permease [Paraliomyxa miuraensis]
MSESVYKRIDRAVYQAERAIVVGALLVMALVVFVDVVHRSFSGEESKLAIVAAKVGGWFGADLLPGTPGFSRLESAAPYVLAVVFTTLGYIGIRTAKRAKPIAPLTALAISAAGVLVAYGLVRLLLVMLPNGLTWSQDLALVLTLWVGFVGASMCTYENRHLRVEAAQRALPEKFRPSIAFISGLFTTTVCLVLVWLSLRYVTFHYQEYVSTDGKGGLFPGMDLPKYLGFSALPLAFSFMTIRYFVKALAALRGELEVPLDPVEAAGGIPQDRGPQPSEIATEARQLHTGEEDKQSAIDTMTSKAHMSLDNGIPRPQSKVPTDAHDVIPMLASAMGKTEAEDDLRQRGRSGELISKDDDDEEAR